MLRIDLDEDTEWWDRTGAWGTLRTKLELQPLALGGVSGIEAAKAREAALEQQVREAKEREAVLEREVRDAKEHTAGIVGEAATREQALEGQVQEAFRA